MVAETGQESTKNDQNKEKSKVFSDQERVLRKRAKRCRIEARIFLVAIVVLLAAGAYVFSEAVEIAASDIAVAQQGDVHFSRVALMDELDELQSIRQNLMDRKGDNEKLNKTYDAINEIIQQIKGLDDAANNTSDSDLRLTYVTLIQLNITRFGTLAILVFTATMFLSVYRYSIRLSVFYDSQADKCLLFSTRKISKRFLVQLATVSPPVDFGRMPSTPLENIVETANKARELFRS